MIRINLVGGEHRKTRRPAAVDLERFATPLCGLVLVSSVLGIGWWYWTLSQTSTRLDEAIVAAQSEQARLRSLLADLGQFEARKAQLQQRVQLIEQLREGQSVPVRVLDHISRSLPDMLWLTSLEQEGDVITIEGRSTAYLPLSDFVGNLADSSLLAGPVVLVKSQVESTPATEGKPSMDLITFAVKAQMTPTRQPAAVAPGGAPSGAAATGAPR